MIQQNLVTFLVTKGVKKRGYFGVMIQIGYKKIIGMVETPYIKGFQRMW